MSPLPSLLLLLVLLLLASCTIQWGIHPNQVGATKMKAGLQGASYITAVTMIIIITVIASNGVKS